MKIVNPSSWKRPSGFSHAIKTSGELLFVSGQVGWNSDYKFESDEFADQVQSALQNVVTVLEAGGAKPEHVVRMTWYVLSKYEYLAATDEIGSIYRHIFGDHYPAMSLVVVSGLLEDRAKVEIEATAVIPD